jgi:hypothetical protein
VEFAYLSDDFGEAVSEAIEEGSASALWKSAAEHFEDMLGGLQGVEYPVGVKTGWKSSQGCWRGWDEVSGVGASQMILTLQVRLGDLKIVQRHIGASVAEELHDGGQGDAGTQHLRGICVTKLVRDDAARNSNGSCDSPKRGTELERQ